MVDQNGPSLASAPLSRKWDWEERLTHFISDSVVEGVCLDWDNFNCVSWCADAAFEITGFDVYAEARNIKSPLRLAKYLADGGFKSAIEQVALSFPDKPLIQAQRGDLVVAAGRPVSDFKAHVLEHYGVDLVSEALCLADPPFAWSLTEQGPVRIPLIDCTRALAVGTI